MSITVSIHGAQSIGKRRSTKGCHETATSSSPAYPGRRRKGKGKRKKAKGKGKAISKFEFRNSNFLFPLALASVRALVNLHRSAVVECSWVEFAGPLLGRVSCQHL